MVCYLTQRYMVGAPCRYQPGSSPSGTHIALQQLLVTASKRPCTCVFLQNPFLDVAFPRSCLRREEIQVIFAQVASGFGRDPVLNAEANLHPASAAVARVARTLNIVNGDSYPAGVHACTVQRHASAVYDVSSTASLVLWLVLWPMQTLHAHEDARSALPVHVQATQCSTQCQQQNAYRADHAIQHLMLDSCRYV